MLIETIHGEKFNSTEEMQTEITAFYARNGKQVEFFPTRLGFETWEKGFHPSYENKSPR